MFTLGGMNALLIALSGGVDSSVAAYLLREQWDTIIGATHYIWPDSRCCSEEVTRKAKAICQNLGIPYYLIDLYSEFKTQIVDDFINTYIEGKTPNPCVLCNQLIRFDLFYNRAKMLLKENNTLKGETDLYIATGHYARIAQTSQGYFLKKAKDTQKDQTYMLYRLPKKLLNRCVFPLGDILKSEVKSISQQIGLDYEQVDESQDACFVKSDYTSFIAEYRNGIPVDQSGGIYDLDGHLLGEHKGYLHYTVGQRKGLNLGNGPWYVATIEPETNRVYVSHKTELRRSNFEVERINWYIDPPVDKLSCSIKIRYRSQEIPGHVVPQGRETASVILDDPQNVTPGQSAVFYFDELLIGGGIIRKI